LAHKAGFLALPADINGQAVSLLLDTGADAGLVTPQIARQLALPSHSMQRTLLQGTGGNGGWARIVTIHSLMLGRLNIIDQAMPGGPLPAAPNMVPPVAGLLGGDILSAFDIEIDLPDDRLAFYRASLSCGPGGLPPWSGAYDTVPLQRIGRRLVATVLLDGQPVRALVDTGARSTILDTETAARLGIGPDVLARDPGGIGGGIDMQPVEYRWHRFRSLQVGPEVINRPVLTVLPHVDATEMLLGADFFQARRVWLSYATSRMFIRRTPHDAARR
jgi:predicted aspartyl protease